MQKKRLTIVTNNLYSYAGGEKLALDIATGLKEDFEITILNPVSAKDTMLLDRKKLAKLYNLSGIRIVDLKNLGLKTKVFGGEAFVLKSLTPGALAVFAKELKKADLVYTMSLNPLLLLNTVMFSKLFNKKLVLGVHNFSLAKMLESNDSLKSRIVRGNTLRLLGQIDYFHVTSMRDYKLIRRFFPKAEVRLIPNPIRDEKKPVRYNAKEFVCLYVGRLEKSQKGIDLLCTAIEQTLKRNDKIKFTIVGAGGDGEKMVSELAARYKNNVRWLGFLSGKKLDDAYGSASLLAFPSRYDTFSIALLESQSKGIPAVAFDIDGARDVINKPIRGTRVPAFDTRMFSKEVERYSRLWKDSPNYKKLRERIRNSAYSDYGKEKILGELKKMFEDAVSSSA